MRASGSWLRLRVEIMGSQKCGAVGNSQSGLIMISPIIFTRTRGSGWWLAATGASPVLPLPG
jgi:hypothetical protein